MGGVIQSEMPGIQTKISAILGHKSAARVAKNLPPYGIRRTSYFLSINSQNTRKLSQYHVRAKVGGTTWCEIPVIWMAISGIRGHIGAAGLQKRVSRLAKGVEHD